jgi:polysaccharide biosynthesis protein PslG
MRRLKISLLSITALAVLAIGAASAQAAMKLGIEDENVFVSGNPIVSSVAGYQMLDDLNIKTMRVLVTQSSVQDGNSFDFSAYKNMLAQAKQNGVTVQVVLVGKYPRPNYRTWPKFAQAAAEAFKGQVTFYSIWNEPNLKAWIAASNKGATYRKIYTLGYKAVRQGDPSAKILMGETAPFVGRSPGIPPLKFLRQLACVDDNYKPLKGKRCPTLQANGYAHHPYDLDRAPRRSNRGDDSATIGTLPNLTRALRKLKSRLRVGSSVYLTEFGYASQGPHAISESKRAAYLKQAYSIARHTRGVKMLVQYLLLNPSNRNDPFPTGLLTPSGDQTPAYSALKSVNG